eukprot:7060418-Prymnesium_polylepis.1
MARSRSLLAPAAARRRRQHVQLLVALPAAGAAVVHAVRHGALVRVAAAHEVAARVPEGLHVHVRPHEQQALDGVQRVVVAEALQLLCKVAREEQAVRARHRALEEARRLGRADVERRRRRHPPAQQPQHGGRLRGRVAQPALGGAAERRPDLVRAPQVQRAVRAADAAADAPRDRLERAAEEEAGPQQRQRRRRVVVIRRHRGSPQLGLDAPREVRGVDAAPQAGREPKATLLPLQVRMRHARVLARRARRVATGADRGEGALGLALVRQPHGHEGVDEID